MPTIDLVREVTKSDIINMSYERKKRITEMIDRCIAEKEGDNWMESQDYRGPSTEFFRKREERERFERFVKVGSRYNAAVMFAKAYDKPVQQTVNMFMNNPDLVPDDWPEICEANMQQVELGKIRQRIISEEFKFN